MSFQFHQSASAGASLFWVNIERLDQHMWVANLQLLPYFLLCRCWVSWKASPCNLLVHQSWWINFILSGGGARISASMRCGGTERVLLISCTQLSKLLDDWCRSLKVIGSRQNCSFLLMRPHSHLSSRWRGRTWRRLLTARKPLVVAFKTPFFVFYALLSDQVHQHFSVGIARFTRSVTQKRGNSTLHSIHVLVAWAWGLTEWNTICSFSSILCLSSRVTSVDHLLSTI